MSIPPRAELASTADPITHRADPATIAESLALFLSPDDVVEIRAFEVKRPGRVVAGFVRADRVRAQSGMIAHIADHAAGGCYFTPQQLAPAVFDRTRNMIVETKKRKGETFPRLTHDEDVTARRFLMIDVDPVRAGGEKRATTDSEKEAGRRVADAIIADLTASRWPAPLEVDSGNGWHLYYRMAVPFLGGKADPETDPYAQFLHLLAEAFGTPEVNIDTQVYNSSRIMRLPGTVNRKGTHTEQHPHRWAFVACEPADWINALVSAQHFAAKVEAFDPTGEKRQKMQRQAKQAEPKSTAVSVSVSGSRSVSRGLELPLEEKIKIALNYLKAVPGAIEMKEGGTIPGKAEKDTLWACRVATLGCDLDQETALAVLMSEWNTRCQGPWDERGLRHKLEDAATLPFGKPRGWILEEHLNRGMEGTNATEIAPQFMNGTAPAPTSSGNASELPNGLTRHENEAENDPHYLARAFLIRRFNKSALVFWWGGFYEWNAGAYSKVSDDEMSAAVNRTVHHHLKEMDRLFPKKPKEGQEPPVLPRVTNALVGDVIGALKAKCIVKSATYPPAWINGATGHDPRYLIAAKNGLVHLPIYAAGGADAIAPLTPDLFNLNVVPYAVSPTAPEPVQWLKFLDSIWPNDSESVSLLQEWFGYLLTPDTTQQKMLLLFGASGGGKTTILKVLQEMLGKTNCVSTDLNTLDGEFGLSNMLGKSVAIIGDARINPRSLGQKVAVARLLSIIGESPVTVNIKGEDLQDVKLIARFVVATNELFNLKDSAMSRRLSVLQFRKSFTGKEDTGLAKRLFSELPSIFNWAVEGWQKLCNVGRFTQPASSASVTESLASAGCDLADFVEEFCVLGESERARRDELFEAWNKYREANKIREVSMNKFFEMLENFKPGQIKRSHPWIGQPKQKVRCVDGIALKVEGQQSIDYGDNQEDADLLELDANKLEDL